MKRFFDFFKSILALIKYYELLSPESSVWANAVLALACLSCSAIARWKRKC